MANKDPEKTLKVTESTATGSKSVSANRPNNLALEKKLPTGLYVAPADRMVTAYATIDSSKSYRFRNLS
jgi:hypothetical protein